MQPFKMLTQYSESGCMLMNAAADAIWLRMRPSQMSFAMSDGSITTSRLHPGIAGRKRTEHLSVV